MRTTQQQRLDEIHRAIWEGRAYLERGKRKVTAYNDATGWAVTGNGAWMNRRSFMVTLDDIKITPEARR